MKGVHADGELATEARLWGLAGGARGELIGIATGKLAFGDASTPLLFAPMRRWLFLVLAHTLYLESRVSHLSQKDKRHPKTHALMLKDTLLYSESVQDDRRARLGAGVRAEIGGALSRAGAAHNATQGKDVHGKARTLGQLSLLGQQALKRARSYRDEDLFARLEGGVARAAKKARAEHANAKQAVWRERINSMSSTCTSTGTSRNTNMPGGVLLSPVVTLPPSIGLHRARRHSRIARRSCRTTLLPRTPRCPSCEASRSRTASRSRGSGPR